MTSGPVSDYRFAAPVAVRMLGMAIAGAGLLVVLTALLVAVTPLPGVVLSVVVVVAVLLVLATGVLAVRRATVVRLDEQGYRVRFVRGAGVTQGRWKDVEDVVATTVEGAHCVVMRRRDGSTTTIPVAILDRDATLFVQDLQRHLNRGHGYRPLSGSS